MSGGEEKRTVKKSQVLLGALLAIVLAAGLYYLNRHWISPLGRQDLSRGGAHPLAPDFSLTDLSGRKLTLADYRGKVVLLNFWATWCGPCRVEIPGFVDLQSKYRDQGLVVIGVSMDDDPAPVREFYERYRMNYPVAMGDDGLAERFGGILGLPTTFLIQRDGHIYAKLMGAEDAGTFEEAITKLLGETSAAGN
jgi:cytochrome c biogenesis protein CcmG, thiol:disulfide interchange protein DsbE